MALALVLGTGVTLFVVTEIVLRIDPWYHPRYLIPLAGMIIGNAMNGATLGAERFRSELILRKNEWKPSFPSDSMYAVPRRALASVRFRRHSSRC